MDGPPFMRMAPATPAPNCKCWLAALTMASVSRSVMSPSTSLSSRPLIMVCMVRLPHCSPTQLRCSLYHFGVGWQTVLRLCLRAKLVKQTEHHEEHEGQIDQVIAFIHQTVRDESCHPAHQPGDQRPALRVAMPEQPVQGQRQPPEGDLHPRADGNAQNAQPHPVAQDEVVWCAQIGFLPGIGQNIVPAILVEKLVEANPGDRMILQHPQRALPQADAEEAGACATGQVEQALKTRQARER